VEEENRTPSFAATGQRATITLHPPYLVISMLKSIKGLLKIADGEIDMGKDVMKPLAFQTSEVVEGDLFIFGLEIKLG
jgi:hypothetical protein